MLHHKVATWHGSIDSKGVQHPTRIDSSLPSVCVYFFRLGEKAAHSLVSFMN